MTERTRPTLGASRAALGRPTRTTIGLRPEDRLIIVAQGIEFHNSRLRAGWRIPDCLVDEPQNAGSLKIPGCRRTASNSARYVSRSQNVNYTIRMTQSKTEYRGYLETRNIHVVYQGHARYGRGPCLGPNNGKGNHWGNSDHPGTEGIYRMAYPYLKVPLTEALYYQYRPAAVRERTGDPRESAVPLKRGSYRNLLHPQLRSQLALVRGYTLAQLETSERGFQDRVRQAIAAHPRYGTMAVPSLPERLRHIVQALPASRLGDFLGNRAYPNDRFWALIGSESISGLGPFQRPILVHYADWHNTVSGLPANGRMDLGATNLRCRVFCHFGCSTLIHNQPILRDRKRWRRAGNDRFAFWTTSTAFADITPYWLYHILTYIPGADRRYRTREWRDVLGYALRRTNDDLNLDHRDYEIR